MSGGREVDIDFTKALPKAELHAHLSGSISRENLRVIWLKKRSNKECLDLDDPLTAIKTGDNGFVDVGSFFPLFDKYIYNLCNDIETVKFATKRVIEDFEADGVRYLELRTTPRACTDTGMTMEGYVYAVNDTLHEWSRSDSDTIEVYLILSIEREMSAGQAVEVVDLAIKYQRPANSSSDNGNYAVGIDLCGNPTKGDVRTFTPAFRRARDHKLGITVHFAEVPQSGTNEELTTILSWNPDRLGHCIHVSPHFKNVICGRRLGLEFCLSCNVLAGLTSSGFENHHLKQWMTRNCSIALSTDDVGIFGSSLSNEYFLAAQTFDLSKEGVIDLSRQAVKSAFAGQARMGRLIDGFARERGMA